MICKNIFFYTIVLFVFFGFQKISSSIKDTSEYNIDQKWNVKSLSELQKTLIKVNSGDTVFIPGDKIFDLTHSTPLIVPSGVTLMSDRGINNNKGALLFTNNFATNPMIYCRGNNIKVVGLRIKGPDGEIKQEKVVSAKIRQARKEKKPQSIINRIYVYGLPNSRGIKMDGHNITIDNCEIYNWSHAGAYIGENTRATIKNSFIHHNQRIGLGYGILVQGEAEIFNNTFDYNRHAIASSGKDNVVYHAHHNTCLENSMIQGHVFDVHGGKDRKDGTNIAGKRITINNNTFFVNNNKEIFRIRGVSKEVSDVFDNIIYLKSKYKNTDLIRQTNGKGNLKIENNKVIITD